jgi:hypothetical protein
MNVLIGTPTYADKLTPETAASVAALRFDGDWEWRVIDHNPFPAPDGRNVVASYQYLRNVVLAGAWDALLTVEHDMVLPVDALEKLAALDVPVAYGVYLFRHGAKVLSAWEYSGDRNLGESLSLQTRNQTKVKLGEPMRVSGCGFGCTLIRRNVVERFPFHDGVDEGQSPDIPFSKDCLSHNVEQWAHFGVLCGHVEGEQILWPFAGQLGPTMKVLARQNVTVSINRQSVRLETGNEYDLPLMLAGELERAGYVTGSPYAHAQETGGAATQPKKRSKPAKQPALAHGD